MQIEILLRPVIAEMERGFFKVADKLQRDQLAINVQEIEAGFRNGQKATLAQYAGLKYYKDDDPELRGIPQGARNMERAKLNKGVREVLRAVRRPDHGGDRAVEICDRDRSVEDADGDIVQGVFSFGPHPVCRAIR